MTRRLLRTTNTGSKKLAALAMLALVGCSSDDGGTKDDAGVADSKPAPGEDASVPSAPDAGPPLFCKEMVECVRACPDLACEDRCKARGSSKTVGHLDAVLGCSQGAMGGECKDKCPDPANPDQSCNACIQATCLAELNDCQFDAV